MQLDRAYFCACLWFTYFCCSSDRAFELSQQSDSKNRGFGAAVCSRRGIEIIRFLYVNNKSSSWLHNRFIFNISAIFLLSCPLAIFKPAFLHLYLRAQLNLERNRISQIANLGGLLTLRILKLRGNGIAVIEGIDSLRALEHLDCASRLVFCFCFS
jgi:hypothetical protein